MRVPTCEQFEQLWHQAGHRYHFYRRLGERLRECGYHDRHQLMFEVGECERAAHNLMVAVMYASIAGGVGTANETTRPYTRHEPARLIDGDGI